MFPQVIINAPKLGWIKVWLDNQQTPRISTMFTLGQVQEINVIMSIELQKCFIPAVSFLYLFFYFRNFPENTELLTTLGLLYLQVSDFIF